MACNPRELLFGVNGRYTLTERGPGGSSRSKIWTARTEREGLAVAFRSVNEVLRWDSDDDGLPFHGLAELALNADLASCALQPCPFAQVSETVVDSGTLYIAYKQHFTEDLHGLMEKRALAAAEVKSFCRQMVAGLDHMHSRGILHRNIKPSHLLIDKQGHLAISGFGNACREQVLRNAPPLYKLSVAPIVTPPERLLGEPRCGKSADIWATGLVVATMVRGGKIPFDGQGCEIGLIFSIFERLGTPCSPHPLTFLPEFSDNFPQWSFKGWDDAQPLLGAAGVQLLTGLTDLDPGQRLTAEAALRHAYFQEEVPGALAAASSFAEGQDASPSADLPVPLSPMSPTSTPARCDAPSATSTQFYLDRDLRIERAAQMRRLVMAQAVRVLVGDRGRNDLCRHIWTFLFQPRRPEQSCLAQLVRPSLGGTHPDTVRSLMMDWLTATCAALNFDPQVVFLGARLVDSFQMPDGASLSSDDYRALVVAGLVVALKAERQAVAGQKGYLAHVTHNDKVVMDLALACEKHVANSLASVSGWGAYHFLCAFATAIPLPPPYIDLAHYFLERSLLSIGLSRHSPSLLAAAACLLAIVHGQSRGELMELRPADVSVACGRDEKAVTVVMEEFQSVAKKRSTGKDLEAANKKHPEALKMLSDHEALEKHPEALKRHPEALKSAGR